MIERICPNCGNSYLADPGRLKYGRQTTCGRKCSYELRAKNKIVNTSLICQVCGKQFIRKPFQIRAKLIAVCSWSCYITARKMGLVTPKPPVLPVSEYNCEQCGKHVIIPAAQKGARRFRFCSADCANEWNTGKNHIHWRGGHKDYYGDNWHRQRARARKRDNYICQECGISEKDYGKKLDVHHLIRFADFASSKEANRLDNLTSLCHRCHLKKEWRDYPNTR